MTNKPIRSFWWQAKNFGDCLSEPIFSHFTGRPLEYVSREHSNKLISVGSIIHCIKPGDVIVGTGTNRDRLIRAPMGAKFISVRGPWTRARIVGAIVPEVYGDPALVLPLIYDPPVEKKFKIGYLPHYVDKQLFRDIFNITPDDLFIDIQADWKRVIEDVKSCELIIASTLHGIITAEAYGIPVKWVMPGKKIVGGRLKYQDYFLGTGREVQALGCKTDPIPDLPKLQRSIVDSILKANSLL